jgi:hypothetical protein
MTKKAQNAEVKDLLQKIPTTRAKKALLQSFRKWHKYGKTETGRKNHRQEGVEYVRISPAIPELLKEEMDIAIKSHLRKKYPTIDTFVEASIRLLLSKQ